MPLSFKNLPYWLFICTFCLLACVKIEAQNRAVVLVFDDSGSMNGAPFLSVDYSMQMIIGLLHPDDELFYIKGINSFQPQAIKITDKQAAINDIQKWTNNKGHGFFGMFEAGMTKLRAAELADKEKWLIVTADGEWKDAIPAKSNVIDAFLKKTKTNIAFLSINDIHDGKNTLYPILDQFDFVDLYKSNPTPDELRKELVKIATTISAYPTKGFDVKKNGNKINFNSELPIQEILVLEQAGKSLDKLSKIKSVTINDNSIQLNDPIELSTFPVMKAWNDPFSNSGRMSGRMTTISDGSKVIPSGASLVLEFDKEVNLDYIELLPKVAAKLIVTVDEGAVPSKSITENVYNVCDNLEKGIINVQLVALDGAPLPSSILKKVNVNTKYDGGEQRLRLEDDTYIGEIPLVENFTSVSVSAEYEGYLNLRSDIVSFNKVPCPKLEGKNVRIEDAISVLDLEKTLEYSALPIIMRDGVDVTDEVYEELELEEISNTGLNFSIAKKDGNFIFTNDGLVSGFLCPSCFAGTGKDSIVYTMNAPSQTFEKKSTLTLVIEKTDAPFWEKCGSCIIKFILLLIGLIYLWGIAKKPRFAWGALIGYKRITEYVPSKERNYELKTNFFNRYLVPFVPERKTVQGISFQAGEDDSYITLPKKSQKKEMYIQNNIIQKPGIQDRQIISRGKLEIRRRNRTDEYIYKKG